MADKQCETNVHMQHGRIIKMQAGLHMKLKETPKKTAGKPVGFLLS